MNKSGKEKRISFTVLVMVFATVAAKLLGLVRDILLAKQFGTGIEAVAFETASRLPLLIYDFVIGGVITAAFIPVFNDTLVKKGKKDAMRFASDYFLFITLLTSALCILGEIFASPFVKLLAPGLEIEAFSLAVSLTRVLFPTVILSGITFSFVGILQSFGHFRLPAIISLFSNAVNVIYLLFFADTFGIYGLAVSMLIGWALQGLVQLPTALSSGFKIDLRLSFATPEMKAAIKSALPILISSWLTPFAYSLCLRFSSYISGGSQMAALSYAYRLFVIISGIFTFVATNLLFPYLSRSVSGGEEENVKKISALSIKILMLILLPISFGLAIYSKEITEIIYMRGSFTALDAENTANALLGFAFAVPAVAISDVMLKLWFARRDHKTPTLLSVLLCILSLPLAYLGYLLARGENVLFISLSYSLVIILFAISVYICYGRKYGSPLNKRDASELLRFFAFSLAMGGACVALKALFSLSALISLIFGVVVAMAVYGALNLIFPFSELKGIVRRGVKGDTDEK